MNHVRPTYPYQRSKDQTLAQRARHPVIVVGAGPIGLTAAIDLKLRGIPVVLLDEDNTSSEGSRAIAYARRTLQIWDRLGCVEGMLARGVQWTSGKVFWGEKKVYEYGMGSGRSEEAFPPFLNLQQYHVEEQLVQRCIELGVDLRWNNRVTGLDNQPGGPVLKVATPDGEYELACDWLLAADGASSTVRRQLGLSFQGKVFDEKFLICDVRMRSDFPPERWFWFDPPFNRGQSALLHMQADGVWRVGMQLGVRQEDSFDAEREKSPERVVPRLRAMLGEKTDFELIWSSIYTFKCRRLEQFRAGRVLFIGDSAHQVSPFGGRGANSGVQDVDNLGWKLQLVLQGLAPESLIDSYHEERSVAADENILHSTRATDFITPKNRAAVLYRDAVLGLATRHAFARALINSGRPSAPTT
jgi:3-(3-hydroxy-phenyl)propionate hydroxylase